MEHPFIEWLRKEAVVVEALAARYREAAAADSTVNNVLLAAYEGDREELLARAMEYAESAHRIRGWSRLAEEMIGVGLEECTLQYYDAKQAIEPHLLPCRPEFTYRPQLDAVLSFLEGRIKATKEPHDRELLQAIESAMLELSAVGLTEVALQYYRRRRQQSETAHLALPDASDADEEMIREEYPPITQIVGEHLPPIDPAGDRGVKYLASLKQKAMELLADRIEEARAIRRQGPKVLDLWNSHRPPERRYADLDHLMEELYQRPVQAMVDFVLDVGLLDRNDPKDQALIRELVGAMARI